MKPIAFLMAILMTGCSLLNLQTEHSDPPTYEECRRADTAAGMDKAFTGGFALTSLGLAVHSDSNDDSRIYGAMFTGVLAVIFLGSAVVGSDLAEDCWADVPSDTISVEPVDAGVPVD